jgi:hypothetical protein
MENQTKKCMNYRNTRPLSKEEDMAKGSVLDLDLVDQYNILDLLPTT